MQAFGIDGGALPEAGGVYVLVLRHAGPPLDLAVGALGAVRIEPGFYAYVGSARSGLRARIARHLRREPKRLRWHVDYLRESTEPTAVLAWPGEGLDECALSAAVGGLAHRSVPGFGASDCRCASHLHHFARDPVRRLERLRRPCAGGRGKRKGRA